MVAVIGLDKDSLLKICTVVKDLGTVELANHNSPSQLIITGEEKALEKASGIAKEKGARLVKPLKVSGPWHSRFMAEAQTQMKEVLKNASLKKLNFPVIANYTADYELEPDQIQKNLVNQITSPVLWTDSMNRFTKDGNSMFIEVGPNKVLSKLMRDINREVKAIQVEDMGSLEKCKRFLEENS